MHLLCNPLFLSSLGPLFLQALANPVGKGSSESLQEREVDSRSKSTKLDLRWSALPYPDRVTI